MNYLELLVHALLFYLVPVSVGFAVHKGVSLLLRTPLSPKYLFDSESRHLSITVSLFHSLSGKSLPVPEMEHLRSVLQLTQMAVFFATGSISLLVWALVSTAISNAAGILFVYLFFGVVFSIFLIVCCTVIISCIRALMRNNSILTHTKIAIDLVIIVLITLFFYYIWANTTATPLNWDLYQHQTLATLIQHGNFNFFTSEISDTFGFMSYPPTFHLPLALSQFGLLLSPQNILSYWTILSILHAITVGLASYCLAYVVSRDRATALIACIFGVGVFENVMAFTSLFALPQNLTATVAIFLLAGLLIRLQHRKHGHVLFVLGICVTLVLNHFVIGTAGALLLLCTYAGWRLSSSSVIKTHYRSLTGITLVLIAALVAGSYSLDLSNINRGEAAAFTFSLQEKMKLLYGMYSVLFLLIVPSLWSYFKRSASFSQQLCAYLFILCTLVVFSGIPYSLKFLTLFHFFFVILLAAGLVKITRRLGTFGSISLALVITTILLTTVSARWQQALLVDNQARHVSVDELAAAEFLFELDQKKSTIIISDPATQFILEGLSGVNTPGGAFPDNSVRDAVTSIGEQYALDDPSLQSINDKIKQLQQPSARIVALSGRTFRWLELEQEQRSALDFNIWRPYRLTVVDQAMLELISSLSDAQVLFKNDSVVLFKLTDSNPSQQNLNSL